MVGYIVREFVEIIRPEYSNVFIINDTDKKVKLNDNLNNFDKRTDAVQKALLDMRDKQLFKDLKGWRNEFYSVKVRFDSEPLMKIERAASSIFGIISRGCHVNGYVKNNGVYKLWIAKRSLTKPTYPGHFDNLSAGGLTSGLGVVECAIKELEEECCLSSDLAKNLRQVDAITYANITEHGITRECEFVFDLKLPESFQPKVGDNEVEQFYLMTIDEAKEALIRDDFKPNSALITLNFMYRKGLINPDNDQNYLYVLEKMHAPGY